MLFWQYAVRGDKLFVRVEVILLCCKAILHGISDMVIIISRMR